MIVALYALLAVSAALAWVIARRRPEHLPVALALTTDLATELAGAALLAWVLPPPNPDPAAPPFEGTLRVAVYFTRALFIAWPTIVAALAVKVLARRPAWPVAIGYAVAVSVLCIGYPALRFTALARAYFAIELIALFTAIASAAAWYRRRWRLALAGEPVPPEPSGTLVAAVVAGQAVTLIAGPYRLGLFGEVWALTQFASLALLLVVVFLQAVEVLRGAR